MPDRHSREEMRRLRRAYETMPADARAVFDRHRFEDKDYHQIAGELGIGVAEVERGMTEAMIHPLREADAPEPGRIARFGAWLRTVLRRIWWR